MLFLLQNLGLTTFNSFSSMCQLVGFEVCSVNRTRKLGYKDLNWPRCSARVTESLALTDGSFCRNQNTLYFRLCKICEFMMCILIVDHQFNRMHPWCSWECMLPGRCSPGKRCHTFWNRNIVLLPIRLYAHRKSRIRLLGKSSFLVNKSAYTKMRYIYEKPFFRYTFVYIT